MSVEDFEMVDGNGSFSSECTHGCGMRTKRRNPIGDVTQGTKLRVRNLMIETAIWDFENHRYYELVDVEDLKICGRMAKGWG